MRNRKFYISTAVVAMFTSLTASGYLSAQSLPAMPSFEESQSSGESFTGNGFPTRQINNGTNEDSNGGFQPVIQQGVETDPMGNPINPPQDMNQQRANSSAFDNSGFMEPTSSGEPDVNVSNSGNPNIPNDDFPLDVMTNGFPGPFNMDQPQAYGEYEEAESPEESPIPGGKTEFNKPEPELPLDSEEMSLKNFNSFYEELMSGVEKRLGELDTKNIGNDVQKQQRIREALPNASVEEYSSDLEKMSAVQREIRMLQLKLQQAQLAREVYDTIYPDKLDEYKDRIVELEEHIIKQDEEKKEEIAKIAAEKEEAESNLGDLEFQIEDITARMGKMEEENNAVISDLESKLEEAETKIEEAELKAETAEDRLEYLGGGGDNGGTGTFSTTDGQIVMGPVDENGNPLFRTDRSNGNQAEQNTGSANMSGNRMEPESRVLLPGILRMSGISGRYFAQIQMPDGNTVNATIGNILPNGMEIIEIDSKTVKTRFIDDKDKKDYFLPFGPAEQRQQQSQDIPPEPTQSSVTNNGNRQITDQGLGLLEPGYNPYGIPENNSGVQKTINNANDGMSQERGNSVIPISPPSNF